MGCGGSTASDKYKQDNFSPSLSNVPKHIKTEIYGIQYEDMPLTPMYFSSFRNLVAMTRPLPPIASSADPSDYSNKVPTAACGWEMDFQWHPKASTSFAEGVEDWTQVTSDWFNAALLSRTSQHVCSGREQVLFAGVLAHSSLVTLSETPGCVVLSTGRLLLLSKSTPWIAGAYHVFDLQQITAAEPLPPPPHAKVPAESEIYTVNLEFGDMFPEGPPALEWIYQGRNRQFDRLCMEKPAGGTGVGWAEAPKHLKKCDLKLGMSKQQASMLITVLSKLSLALMRASLRVRAPPTLREKLEVPQPPCDGGFLAVYRATCNYFLLPLNDVQVGRPFYSSIPFLELDLSGSIASGQFPHHHAAAVRNGLLRVQALRGFTLRAPGKNKIENMAWTHLLPVFTLGMFWKIHLPGLLYGSMVQDLASAFCSQGANTVVDLDLSGAEFSAAAAQALAACLGTTRGTLRRIALAGCGLTGDIASPLLDVISSKCEKLEHLDLAQNAFGTIPSPHPLKPIFDSPRLESVILADTSIDLQALIDGLNPGQLATLRILDIARLKLPENVNLLWTAIGTNIEQIRAAGCWGTAEEVACFLNSFSQSGKAPKLEFNFTGIDVGLKGLLKASEGGGLPENGVVISAPSHKEENGINIFNTMEPSIVRHFQDAAAEGLSGAAMMTKTLAQTLETLKATCDVSDWEHMAPQLQKMAIRRLAIRGSNPSPEGITISIQAGSEVIRSATLCHQPTCTGAGPALAVCLQGLAENTDIKELDVSDCVGGDTLAQVLGTHVLKKNRTIRSLKVQGNFFSHVGLSAIRGALYGNKKLVDFPLPSQDCEAILQLYEATITHFEEAVQMHKTTIKRAFKQTKGRKTPQVAKTLKQEVEQIKVDKQKAARVKRVIEKYAKVQAEIQEAIKKNQEDPKNQKAFATEQQKAAQAQWKVAFKAMGKIQALQQKKADMTKDQYAQSAKRRGDITRMWTSQAAAMKKSKQPHAWLEAWMKQNTKEGQGLLVTGPVAEDLLRRIPESARSKVKEERDQTAAFVKLEQEEKAKLQLLNCQIQEQNLVVSNCIHSPHWHPPPATAIPAGLADEQVQQLTKPPGTGKVRVVNPPPDVVAGKLAAPLVQRDMLGQQIKPTTTVVQTPAAVRQSQYEQWRIYQQQQQMQSMSFDQRYYKSPHGFQNAYSYQLNRQHMQDHFNVGFLGAYSYNHYYYDCWYDDPYYCGWGPYSYWDSGDHDGYNDQGYDQAVMYIEPEPADYAFDRHEPSWVGQAIDQGPDDTWEVANEVAVEPEPADDALDEHEPVGMGDACDQGPDDKLEAADEVAAVDGYDAVNVEGAEATDDVVGMYAGGEDDRPGRGPNPGSGSTSVRTDVEVWIPTPPRLDFKEWFQARIQKAELNAREAVIGRIGPLPCSREVILQSESNTTAAICLVTQCSLDRLDKLEAQLAGWDGEVSAAIYVDAAPVGLAAASARQAVLETCAHAAAKKASRLGPACDLPCSWTVTLLYQLPDSEVRCKAYDRLYPINTLRNTALAAARADLVFLLDVDFVPSRALYAILLGQDNGGKLLDALQSKLTQPELENSCHNRRPVALVIPAFETLHSHQPVPRDGSALKEALEAGEVEGFHVSHFPKGHRATNFERWLTGPAGDKGPEYGRLVQIAHGVNAYPVRYEEHFEPYVVVAKADVPAYDERFRGYGLNKISHLYGMSVQGFSFCTVDNIDAFVVAGKHAKSQSWQCCVGPNAEAEQRARIATHFEAFKYEVQAQNALRLRAPTSSCAVKGGAKVLVPGDLPAAIFANFLTGACGLEHELRSSPLAAENHPLEAAAA